MPTTRGRWLALTAALLGWMFDGMEMGLFPLVARDALRELLGSEAAKADVDQWYGIILAAFLIGAATGGVLFGWLGDRIGRVRAMTLSVFVYSLCSGLSAASMAPWHLAALRFLGALGMGGEWALGVALVMELWPNASRAALAGWIGAFGNFGYTICGSMAYGLNRVGGELPGWLASAGLPDDLVVALTRHERWRLLMLIGVAPAFLTLFIRLFVPESEKWKAAAKSGVRGSSLDLLAVLAGAAVAAGLIAVWSLAVPMLVAVPVTVAGLVVVAAAYLYPARCSLRNSSRPVPEQRRILGRMLLAAGLSGVPLLGTWSGVMWMYQWVGQLPGGTHADARPLLQIASSLGAAAGCLGAAYLGGRIGRRPAYAVLCVASAAAVLAFYQGNSAFGTQLVLAAGLLGLVSASFYGWLPLYLPELFPTDVRATGQGFGFNFGRILAAVGNLLLPTLLAAFDGDFTKAALVVPVVYAFGLVFIAMAPETRGKPLPE